jgi:hypothetical protein
MQQVRSIKELSNSPQTNLTANASLVLLLSLGAVVSGTAGTYQVSELNPPELRQFRFPIQEIQPAVSRRKQLALSAAQSLVQIRDVFGLKMSELSQIFGVSRRAAYDWLEGATPKPELTARIYHLSTLAARFGEAGISDVRHFIHRPILGQRTLFELLKTGENLDKAIEVVRVTALEEASARKPVGRRVQDASDIDEESTPIFS